MEHTQCLVVGGGPAGIMLALLLARGGVQVTVLEKHSDFLRHFRGDTVHASTIRLLDEMGLGNAFRRLPQTRLGALELPTSGGGAIPLGNFAALKPPYNYIAMLPQWDFLNFLVSAAQTEPSFSIRMETEVTGLIEQDGKVTGVSYRTKLGEIDTVTAGIVVACDGRGSIVRQRAKLLPDESPVPFDVWWLRLPRAESEGGELSSILPRFEGPDVLLAITREGFYQIAYFLPKGGDAALRSQGIESFRARIARLRPDFADRLQTLTFEDVHMLDVKLNLLPRWHRPGLLLIGDAAHAMSPAGGVGVNLAIQDAVAAARILRDPLHNGTLTEADLAKVQRRRMFPTRIIQAVQRTLHDVVFQAAFDGKRSGPPPFFVWLVSHVPGFKSLPARMVAFGPRPEHAPDFARRPQTEPQP
ncbi:FAD-dependent oxidoreductase [Devosia rhizoryzae]|uniref:FAD-dependent oxidoreductase n=1 Tax=Devosia rhizoryzae TaxID=2774137 RepID=A0ABX7CAE1_9HYPH|nr:FAD-dependent oxidoreductase [Devosia rhizoryzae]QQR40229.1 FAD-dependent oxidoreductase [Devosia rhizoryzae]